MDDKDKDAEIFAQALVISYLEQDKARLDWMQKYGAELYKLRDDCFVCCVQGVALRGFVDIRAAISDAMESTKEADKGSS